MKEKETDLSRRLGSQDRGCVPGLLLVSASQMVTWTQRGGRTGSQRASGRKWVDRSITDKQMVEHVKQHHPPCRAFSC